MRIRARVNGGFIQIQSNYSVYCRSIMHASKALGEWRRETSPNSTLRTCRTLCPLQRYFYVNLRYREAQVSHIECAACTVLIMKAHASRATSHTKRKRDDVFGFHSPKISKHYMMFKCYIMSMHHVCLSFQVLRHTETIVIRIEPFALKIWICITHCNYCDL